MPGYSLKNRIHPFAHMGFRFNNAPLKNFLAINRPFRNGDHTYSFTWIGDGNEISLQILDSLISRTERGVSGSYSDNSGSLTVKIEKTKNLVVCDVQPKKLTDSTFEIEVDVAVFTDSLIADSKNTFDTGLVAVFEKDYFLCPDRIECGIKEEMQDSLAIGLLIDRSGSMLLPIDSVTDTTIRIDAIKSAANNYINTMQIADESFLMSFATFVTLDQDWTNDKTLLRNAVNALQAEGWTSLYETVIKGIDKVRANTKPVKGIILLSDGADQHHPDSTNRKIYYSSVLKKIQESPIKVPIYCISLGLSSNPEDVAGRDTLKLIARESGGQYYLINSAKELNDLYADLRTEAIFRKKCCKIVYKVPKCKDKSDTIRTVTVVFPFEGKILTKSLTYRTKCDSTVNSVFEELDVLLPQGDPFQVSELSPNPGSGISSFAYEIPMYGNVSISIINQEGLPIRTLLNAPQDIGRYRLNIDLSSEPQGMYSIVIQHGGEVISKKMMIVR
jgi:Mg-chelatase subunit ChlD